MLSTITATVTLHSMSPLTQSRNYDSEPQLEGESHGDRDLRLWQKHLHVNPETGSVYIPAIAITKALAAAAKYSGKKIVGKGSKTWTAKFEGGIAIFDPMIDLGIKPDDAICAPHYMNADGVRGSGKRVMRHMPQINSWQATFEVRILDPEITRPIFEEMLEIAGMFIGVGQWRPEKGGQGGRFQCVNLAWVADRQPVPVREVA